MGLFDQLGNTLNEGLSEWIGIGQERAAETAVPSTHTQGSEAVNANGANLEQQIQAQEQAETQNKMLKWGMIGGGVLVLLLIFILLVRSK